MRFMEYLIEAPKPRGRMVNGKFVPSTLPQGNRPRPQQPRGQGGRYAPKPALDPMQPRTQQNVDFEQNPNVEPIQPGNKGKPKPITSDSVNFTPDKNVEPIQPKNNTPWDQIIRKAGTDSNAGREFITLLGAMYQAKRRNPNVQMSLPKMVTMMPDKSEDEKKMKSQMTALYNLAKGKDLPELAALSKELQTSRQEMLKQDKIRPNDKPKQPQGSDAQPHGAADNELTSAIDKAGQKSTRKGLQTAIDRLRQLLRRKAEPELPLQGNQKPGIISTG